MKIRHILLAALVASAPAYAQKAKKQHKNAVPVPVYKQATANIEDRVSDLLARMTPEEKVGQLLCPLGWEMYTKTGPKTVEPSARFKADQDGEIPVGGYWAVLRADPWTQKTLENGLNPELAAKAINALQKYVIENTRLGIPLLIAEETPHGHMAIGATVFPTGLGLASSWNPDLMLRVGSAMGAEVRLQGGGVGYGPVLDIAREPRWSRMEETFGEDPVLVGRMGANLVRGIQGNNLADGRHVVSTLKHFAAYGIPEGGLNGDRSMVGARMLQAELLPQFREAVKAGVGSIMTSYNAIDGVPCTSNKYLLDDVLRKEWGFDGAIYSDLYSIDGIAGTHHVAANQTEAGALSLKATVDIDLGANCYGRRTLEALNQGLVSMADIDNAVANVLRLKFRLGLFENPYTDPSEAKRVVRSAEHKAVAREAAREGIVLLKNNGVLPLSKDIKNLAVIGPNADMQYNQLGDYTAPQDDKYIITPLEGIQAAIGAEHVTYVKGCAVRDTSESDIEGAVRAANAADAVVLVVGGSSARDFKTTYAATGAANVGNEGEGKVIDMDCGEGYDRQTLELLGDQNQLMEAVIATGKPVVVVYIEGRTLDMNYAAENAAALLTAWYPGEEGGNGLADVLFGDYNPAGRLPVSIQRSVGQLPVYYTRNAGHDYMDGKVAPLYSFGYGLSYTNFGYSDLRLSEGESDIVQRVSCTVTNTGKRDGHEVVQLYIRDCVSSVALPKMMLKHFERVALKAGESCTVTFNITREDLEVLGMDMKRVLEPGDFEVMVGAASDDIRLRSTFCVK